MNYILVAENVNKIYRSRGNLYNALTNVDFSIEEGEFVGIMGPSGAGKTTLLNIIATIDIATEGSIKIDGKDISKMDEDELALFRRDKLGFVFQDFNLIIR